MLLQFIVDVLSLGSLYALFALGLVLVYGILKLVNFAYGELVLVFGYSMFLLNATPFPWFFMALVAILMSIFFSIATDYIAFRPVREKSVTAVLITSFAFATLLQNAALLLISARPKNVPMPSFLSDSVQFLSVITPVRNLISIAVTFICLIIFYQFMKRTHIGLAMRAAATNFNMARMLGIPANLVITTAFAISGLLAGIGGTLWMSKLGMVFPGIGLEPLLIAFIATVIGGMRSVQGAVLGGFILAFVDMSFNYLLPQDILKFRDAFTFTFVILILLIRPEGLIKGPATGIRT
ncbi:MAG: branched-chain amino acid ABC transporter permease [Alphaproteobacteria bacterium]|jgi:branched-chain amino acid transport system permease protein|nr:branched-chain amino acid ABC transporter permease [Alphaproteobacteria bacterium]